jgi:DNA-binding CsgD family transcriptional regulator
MVLRITPWERSVLQLLADGKATSELAGRFRLSEWEVESHLTRLFERLGASNRAEAIAAAFRRGLLSANSSVAG